MKNNFMKNDVIDCICEIIKAYSLESEWTPELEDEIKEKATSMSEEQLKDIIPNYTLAGYLNQLKIVISVEYYNHINHRERTDTSFRYNIIKKYKI